MSRDLARAIKHLALPVGAMPEASRFRAMRGLRSFRDFVDVALWETLHLAHWRHHGPSSIILREGVTGDGFVVLVSGEMLSCREGRTLEPLGSGNVSATFCASRTSRNRAPPRSSPAAPA